MQHSLTAKIGPWVDAAIDQHGLGENIAWEPALMPGDQGEAVYTVCLWFPGAVLGTIMAASFGVNDPLGATEEKVGEVIAEVFRELRERRSRQVSLGNGRGQHPPEGTRPSGLILP